MCGWVRRVCLYFCLCVTDFVYLRDINRKLAKTRDTFIWLNDLVFKQKEELMNIIRHRHHSCGRICGEINLKYFIEFMVIVLLYLCDIDRHILAHTSTYRCMRENMGFAFEWVIVFSVINFVKYRNKIMYDL